MKHRSVKRRSNRPYAQEFRRNVLRLVGEKYGGPAGEPSVRRRPLGIANGDRLGVDAEALRRWSSQKGCRAGSAGDGNIGADGSARSTLGRGADGRELSPLAGGARSGRLPNGPSR